MKLRACAVGAFVSLAAIAIACSSQPSQPPIDTSGGSPTPNPGSANSPTPSDDAGTIDGGLITVIDDAGIADATSDVANQCAFGTCGGCCTPPPNAQCVPGTTNAQCGNISAPGIACQLCGATQTCTPNGCQ